MLKNAKTCWENPNTLNEKSAPAICRCDEKL